MVMRISAEAVQRNVAREDVRSGSEPEAGRQPGFCPVSGAKRTLWLRMSACRLEAVVMEDNADRLLVANSGRFAVFGGCQQLSQARRAPKVRRLLPDAPGIGRQLRSVPTVRRQGALCEPVLCRPS